MKEAGKLFSSKFIFLATMMSELSKYLKECSDETLSIFLKNPYGKN